MPAIKLNVAVSPVALSVERMAVSVSGGIVERTVELTMPSDIGDFLKEEIKGPATFSCKSGAGCKFEEPAMNDLIDSIFGDRYITLDCAGGECLHYSQVPGYIVSVLLPHTLSQLSFPLQRPLKPKNIWLAISAGAAGLFVLIASLGMFTPTFSRRACTQMLQYYGTSAAAVLATTLGRLSSRTTRQRS